FGNAARFRFTDLPYGTHLPTRDYERWSGEPFVYKPRRPPKKQGRKIQNPVRKFRTPCTEIPDRVRAAGGGSLCTEIPARVEAGECTEKPDRSSLPLPEPEGDQLQQGSLTARAPVKAGGAGSSPAPVANHHQRRLQQ